MTLSGREPNELWQIPLHEKVKRNVTKRGYQEDAARDDAFRRIVRSIPAGRVSTYARVAEAAGYPLHHRSVARLLRKDTLTALPWQRVVGSRGELRLKGEFAAEQKFRLLAEGVEVGEERVDLDRFQHALAVWEI